MPTSTPSWNADGLAPAVVTDAATGVVLMLAWMNAEAWQLTRTTGLVHFWSRSRQALWQKGETSGNTLRVVELRLDCDADAILVRATPAGPACHTGATSCFFRVDGGPDDDGVPTAPAVDVLRRLEATVRARRDDPATDGKRSYTRSLLDGGAPAILAKLAEEHGELAAELPAGAPSKVVHEAADLLLHLVVALAWRGVALDDVWRELARREGTSGHAEKASRGRP
ncbi:MAG: bifunctional phosphoribosyl-AMP cyclohydrolase/phosphoribosyl-ATP diphosphatase HisIE [Kofleriaceae bacterium]